MLLHLAGFFFLGASSLFGCTGSQIPQAPAGALVSGGGLTDTQTKATQPKPQPTPAVTATIFMTWRNAIGGQVEVIVVSAKAFDSTITGAGMPPEGVKLHKPIAAIIPGPTATSGTLVLGPQADLMKPFEAIRWYELGATSVKLYIGGEQFDSVADAQAHYAPIEKYARPFSKVK